MIISGCFRGENGGRRRERTEMKVEFVELSAFLASRMRGDTSRILDLKKYSRV